MILFQSAKYLPVALYQYFIWDEQIALLQTKIPSSSSFLKYAKKFLPLKILNQIYIGVVEPHFRYCCSVWGNCRESKKNVLQKQQNCGATIITNSSAYASPLLAKLQWPSINEIITRERTAMVDKSINNLAPTNLCNVSTKVHLGILTL